MGPLLFAPNDMDDAAGRGLPQATPWSWPEDCVGCELVRVARVLPRALQGVPMMLMGDEYAHTRYGNNNSYGHDNFLNHFLWNQAWPALPLRKNKKITKIILFKTVLTVGVLNEQPKRRNAHLAPLLERRPADIPPCCQDWTSC